MEVSPKSGGRWEFGLKTARDERLAPQLMGDGMLAKNVVNRRMDEKQVGDRKGF